MESKDDFLDQLPKMPSGVSDLYQEIIDIRNWPSKLVKEEILREASDFLKKILKYTYDSAYVYNIAQLELPLSNGLQQITLESFKLLDEIRLRHLTGNDARQAVLAHLHNLDKYSQDIFMCMLLKDLRLGVNSKTIEKCIPGLIPVFPYMRCALPKDIDIEGINWEQGVIVQEKLDGAFVNINVTLNGLEIYTRNGNAYGTDKLLELRAELAALPAGFQYHGELLATDQDGTILPRKTSNGILNSVLKGSHLGGNVVVVIWDAISLDQVRSRGRYNLQYRYRLDGLSALLPLGHYVRLVKTEWVYSYEAAVEIAKQYQDAGGEGAVIKLPKGAWMDGTSNEQIKLKKIQEADLRIVALIPGKGKYVGMTGAFECVSEDGELSVRVRVKDDKMAEDANADYLHKIIAVQYNEKIVNKQTGTHSLFLPRMVEIRFDKDVADTLEQIA
jgi:DNA ligase-1